MQALPGLAEENATLRSKEGRMRTAMTSLHLERGAVFMAMDEIRALCNKTRGFVTEVTNVKKPKLESKVELQQSSKHAAAANVREEGIKKYISATKGGAGGKPCGMRQSAAGP